MALSLGLVMLAFLITFTDAYGDDPPLNSPPTIEMFVISEGPAWTFEFYGYVSDPDNSTEGYVVEFGGTVDDYNISATVGPDGVFDEVFILLDLESGTVTADTKDPEGAAAETVGYWVEVTQ